MTEEERRRRAMELMGFTGEPTTPEETNQPFYPTGASDGMDWSNAQGVDSTQPTYDDDLTDWEGRYAEVHGFNPGEGNNATYREELATRYQSEDYARELGRELNDQDFIDLYYNRGDAWNNYLSRADEALANRTPVEAETTEDTSAPVGGNRGGGNGYADDIADVEAQLASTPMYVSEEWQDFRENYGPRQARQDAMDAGESYENTPRALDGTPQPDPRTGNTGATYRQDRQDLADLTTGDAYSNTTVYGNNQEVWESSTAREAPTGAPDAVTRREDRGDARESNLSVEEEQLLEREGRLNPEYQLYTQQLAEYRQLEKEWQDEQVRLVRENLGNYEQDVEDAGLTQEQSAEQLIADLYAQREEDTPPTRRSESGVTNLQARGGDSVENNEVYENAIPGWMRTIIDPLAEIPDVRNQAMLDIAEDPWDLIPGFSNLSVGQDALEAFPEWGAIINNPELSAGQKWELLQESAQEIQGENDNPLVQMILGTVGKSTEGLSDLGAAIAQADADARTGKPVDWNERLSPEGGSQFAMDYANNPQLQAEFRSRVREGMTPLEAARSLETWKSVAGEFVFDPTNLIGLNVADDIADLGKVGRKIGDAFTNVQPRWDGLLDEAPRATDFIAGMLDDTLPRAPRFADNVEERFSQLERASVDESGVPMGDYVKGEPEGLKARLDQEMNQVDTLPRGDVDFDAPQATSAPDFATTRTLDPRDEIPFNVATSQVVTPRSTPNYVRLIQEGMGRPEAKNIRYIGDWITNYSNKYFGTNATRVESVGIDNLERFFVNLSEGILGKSDVTPAQYQVAQDFLALHKPDSIPVVRDAMEQLVQVVKATPDDTAKITELTEQIYTATNGNYLPRWRTRPDGEVALRLDIRAPRKGNAFLTNLNDGNIIRTEVKVVRPGTESPNKVAVQFFDAKGKPIEIKYVERSRLRRWDGKYTDPKVKITETAQNVETAPRATTQVADAVPTQTRDVTELQRMRDVTEAEIARLDKNDPNFRRLRDSRRNAFNRAAKKAGFETTWTRANEYIVNNGVVPIRMDDPAVVVIRSDDNLYRDLDGLDLNSVLTNQQLARLDTIKTDYNQAVQRLNPNHKDYTKKKTEITQAFNNDVRKVTGNNFHTVGGIDTIVRNNERLITKLADETALDARNVPLVRTGWAKIRGKADRLTAPLRRRTTAVFRALDKVARIGAGVAGGILGAGGMYLMQSENGRTLLEYGVDQEGEYVGGLIAEMFEKKVQERNLEGQVVSRDKRWPEMAGDFVTGMSQIVARPAVWTQQMATMVGLGMGIPMPGVDGTEAEWFRTMTGKPNLTTAETRALYYASQNGYSGTVKETYDEIMKLGAGATEEDIATILWGHKNVAMDFMAEMFLDPVGIVGMFTDIKGAGMGSRYAQQTGESLTRTQRLIDGMRTFGVRPLLDLVELGADKVRLPTAKIGRELRFISNQVSSRIEGSTTREALDSLEKWIKSTSFTMERGAGMETLQALNPDEFMRTIRQLAVRTKIPLTPERVAHFATVAAYELRKEDIMLKYGWGSSKIGQAAALTEETIGKIAGWQKRMLSPLLLTFSPRYHIRNFANNYATSLVDGWINYDTPEEIIKWWSTHGGGSLPPMFREAWDTAGRGTSTVNVNLTGADLLRLGEFNDEQVAAMRLQQAVYLDMFPRMWGASLGKGTVEALRTVGVGEADITRLVVELSDLHNGADVRRVFNRWAGTTGGNAVDLTRVLDEVTLPTFYRTRAGTFGAAQAARDFTLFNYEDRYVWDSLLEIAAPYQFWTTRSVWSWTQRMVENPEMFGRWVRLEEAFREGVNAPLRDDDPDYLQNKLSLPTSANPYMGAGVAAMLDSLVIGAGLVDAEKVDQHGLYVNVLATFLPLEDVFALITDMGYETKYPEDIDPGVKFAATIIDALPGTSPIVDAAVSILDRTFFAESKDKLSDFHDPTAPVAMRDVLNPWLRANSGGSDLDTFYRTVMGYGGGKPDYVDRNVVNRLIEEVRGGDLTEDEAIRALADEGGMTYEEAREYVLQNYEARGRMSFATGVSILSNPYGEARDVKESYYNALDGMEKPDGTFDYNAYNAYQDADPASRLVPLVGAGRDRARTAQDSIIGDTSSYLDRALAPSGVDTGTKESRAELDDEELRSMYDSVTGLQDELGGASADRTRSTVERGLYAERDRMSERPYQDMNAEYQAFKTDSARQEYLQANPGFASARRLMGERTETNPLFKPTPAMREATLQENPVEEWAKAMLLEAGYTEEEIANMTSFESYETKPLQEYFDYTDKKEEMAGKAGLTIEEIDEITAIRDANEERGAEGRDRFEGVEKDVLDKYYEFRDLIGPFEDWDRDGVVNSEDPDYKAEMEEQAKKNANGELFETYNAIALEGSGLNQAQLDEIKRIRDEAEENGVTGRQRFDGIPQSIIDKYYSYNDLMQPYYDAQDAEDIRESADIWGMTPEQVEAELSSGGSGGGSNNYSDDITVGATRGASEGQVKFMVGMGVPQGYAEGLTSREAGLILDDLQVEALASIGMEYRELDRILEKKEYGESQGYQYPISRAEQAALSQYYDAVRQVATTREWGSYTTEQVSDEAALNEAMRLAGYLSK